MNKKSIEDMDVYQKKVLVRCDLNVPMEGQEITDDARIRAALPTIEYLIKQRAKVVVMSHLGRPGGKYQAEFSLAPVAKRLGDLVGQDLLFSADRRVASPAVRDQIEQMAYGQILVLENTRFRAEETANDPLFAQELAGLADVFINDAFGTSHRSHASNVGVGRLLPSALGFLVKKEVDILSSVLERPTRPFVAILGGAKVSDKIGVIENLVTKVDGLIIGGAMAFTFLKAQAYSVGRSLVEDDKLILAQDLLQLAKDKGVNIYLPTDVVVAQSVDNTAPYKTVAIEDIPTDWMGLDIGEKTIAQFMEVISKARTLIWNGPMGVFEMDNFAKGSFAIAKALADGDRLSIVGGGDSAAAVVASGFADKMTHISTGGGASLAFMEGQVLPGIDVISDQE